MKTIQGILGSILIIIIFLTIMIMPARSAVVTTITEGEFNILTTTYDAAWSAVYRGGGTSGFGSEEIQLRRNSPNPQLGGVGDTLIGNLTWSSSGNDLEILIDGAANLTVRANSTTVGPIQVIRPFNQILVMLYDEHVLDAPSLTSIDVNGNSVRDLFADGFGYPGVADIVSVTEFGSQAPFVLNAVWNPGDNPGFSYQFFKVVALQNAAIPEPSSSVLLGGCFLLMLRRKR